MVKLSKTGKILETPLQMQIVELLALDFAEEDLIFYAVPNGANLPKKKNKRF